MSWASLYLILQFFLLRGLVVIHLGAMKIFNNVRELHFLRLKYFAVEEMQDISQPYTCAVN